MLYDFAIPGDAGQPDLANGRHPRRMPPLARSMPRSMGLQEHAHVVNRQPACDVQNQRCPDEESEHVAQEMR
jgi:hypothetical protein